MPAYNGYPFPDPPHDVVYLPNIDGIYDIPVRSYICSLGKIDDPEKYVELRRRLDPLLYPFMWYVHDNQVAIVNKIDLDAYLSSNGLPKLLPNDQLNFIVSPYDHLYPYTSPYWYLNPICCLTKEESLDHALKFSTYCNTISSDLEFWLTYQIMLYSEKEGEEACAICLKDFKLRELLTALPCGHYYHGSCIKESLTWKNQCPLCRRPGYIVPKWCSYLEALVGHVPFSEYYRWWAPQDKFGIDILGVSFSLVTYLDTCWS